MDLPKKLKKKRNETKRKARKQATTKVFYTRPLPDEKYGIIHVKARVNNIIYTLTDLRGNTLSTITGGSLGYKNAQKSTWVTARKCAYAIIKKARKTGRKHFYVNLRGICPKRYTAIWGIKSARCKVIRIIYRTALPHNGCRVLKKRRK